MTLARTGSRILLWRVLQKAANALAVVVVAQALGPTGNGHYSLTLMVVMVAAALLAGGVGLASVPSLRDGGVAPRRILAAQGLWIVLVTVVLAAVAAAAQASGIRNWLGGALGWDASLLLAAATAVVAMVVFETANYDLLAAGQVVQGTRVAAVRALVQLAGVVALVLVWQRGLAAAIWVFATVQIVAAVVMAGCARRAIRRLPDTAAGRAGRSLPRLAAGLVRRGWLGQLSALTYLLLLRLDQPILESYAGVAAVGIYALAAWGGELLWLVPEALNPLLVHSSSDRSNGDRDAIAARTVRVGLCVTALAAVPMALLAGPLLGLLRDGAYLSAVAPLRALLPGIVAFAPGAILAGDFIGRGRPHWNTQASAVTVVTNVGLCLVWIPRAGILGAAWASTVAYALGALVMLLRFRRATGCPWSDLLFMRFSDLSR